MKEGDILQKAILGVNNLNISQGYNGAYSHKGGFAIDLISGTSNYVELRAPFDGIIKKVYTKTSNVVWLESLNKVKYANGIEDYMTIMTMHDNDVSDLYVGKTIKQGEVYYRSGTAGNVTGPHIHLEVGRGKFLKTGWYQNEYGKWNIYNNMRANDALFLPLNTTITYGYGYDWIRENEVKEVLDTNIDMLQMALNSSYNTKLKNREYDNEIIKVIAKNNLRYKTPTIKNDFVRWVQINLNLVGYNLDIDRSYGRKTRNAVLDFQKKYGLKVDGIVGNGVVKTFLNLNI